MVNVLHLFSTFLFTVDHVLAAATTSQCAVFLPGALTIHILMAYHQEHIGVHGLVQEHFDMLTAGSGIKPETFQSLDNSSTFWAKDATGFLSVVTFLSLKFLFAILTKCRSKFKGFGNRIIYCWAPDPWEAPSTSIDYWYCFVSFPVLKLKNWLFVCGLLYCSCPNRPQAKEA